MPITPIGKVKIPKTLLVSLPAIATVTTCATFQQQLYSLTELIKSYNSVKINSVATQLNVLGIFSPLTVGDLVEQKASLI